MSRKRKPKHKKPEAVPHAVDPLAEGTGPVAEVVDADAQSLAEAAAVAFSGAGTSGAEGELTDDELSEAQPSSALDDTAPPAEHQADALATPEAASDLELEGADMERSSGRSGAAAAPGDTGLEGDGEPASDLELAPEGDAEGDLSVDGADAVDGEPTEAAATLPTSAAAMEPAELKHLVEALVFASDKPVTLQRLRQLTRVSDVRRLEQALAELGEDFRDRGISLQSVSGGYQFRTHTKYSGWVQQLIAGRPVRLSRAQLETLSIIAYRQPITRPEIDEIRGVDSSGTLRVLIERSLIRILGKREEVGRPMLYGTTKEFLDFFSLTDLRELPTLREYSELTAESRRVMSDRLGVELEGEAPEVVDHDPSDSPIAAATDEVIAAAAPEASDDVADDPAAQTGADASGDVGEPRAADAGDAPVEMLADASGDLGGSPSGDALEAVDQAFVESVESVESVEFVESVESVEFVESVESVDDLIGASAADAEDGDPGDPAAAPSTYESIDEGRAEAPGAMEMAPFTTDEALAQSFDDDVDAVIATQEQDLEDDTVGEGPTDEAIETAAGDTVLAELEPSSAASADDTSDSVIDPVE